jgi:hypothetical protein
VTKRRLPRLVAADRCQSRADRFDAVYLRAAQAYMLISMPTGTSTIFGVFQVIRVSQVVCKKSLASSLARGRAGVEPKTTLNVAQVRKTERRTPSPLPDERYFSLGQSDFTLGLSSWSKHCRDTTLRDHRRLELLTAANPSAVRHAQNFAAKTLAPRLRTKGSAAANGASDPSMIAVLVQQSLPGSGLAPWACSAAVG